MICRVCIEGAVVSFDRLYSYLVPSQLEGSVVPGVRVLVPFGGGNRTVQATVFFISNDSDSSMKLKAVIAVLDSEPPFSQEALAIAVWLKENTFCSFSDGLRIQIPAGLGMKLSERFAAVKPGESSVSEKEPDNELERNVFAFLLTKRAPVSIQSIKKAFPEAETETALKNLIKAGLVLVREQADRTVRDAWERMVRLTPKKNEPNININVTKKQHEVIDYLADAGETPLRELMYHCGISAAVVNTLQRKGTVEVFEEECLRLPYNVGKPEKSLSEIKLSSGQMKCFDGLNVLFEKECFEKALLLGVTGSGKTLIYIRLIEQCIKSGRGAMLLVPEIALTPQTVRIFHDYFGGEVAVLHSSLPHSQRLDEWKRVKRGDAKIVVGTRSAVFAPVKSIGLMIIDEEQESSYQSDMSPRFDARKIADLRCRRHGALLLLASATPSLKTYYECGKKADRVFRLAERFGGAALPEVFTVDMRRERIRPGKIISGPLSEEINANLENKEQSVLLLNRRGHNTSLSCLQCGITLECRNCSVPMVYHKANGRVMCHYCGYSLEHPRVCLSCGSNALMFEGAGTQKAESEIAELFPEARILRMDIDTTFHRNSHETLLSAFGRGEYDILLGTQMIAKGLNFPRVTLVGVLGIDAALNSPDYRGAERAFALLTQVVGRSGRGEARGRAFIQTHETDHRIISLAARQDFEGFAESELAMRKIALYPPFCDIYEIGFSSEEEEMSAKGAAVFLEMLKQEALKAADIPLKILGPAPAAVFRREKRWRFNLTVKCRAGKRINGIISELLRSFAAGSFGNVSVSLDTNR